MDELIFNRAATAIVQSHQQLLRARKGAQLALEILRGDGSTETGRRELTQRVEAFLTDLEAIEQTAQGVWTGGSPTAA